MKMPITPENEDTVQLYAGTTDAVTMREAAAAMFASVEFMQRFNPQVASMPTAGEKNVARAAFAGTAEMESVQTSAAAVHLLALLNEYDKQLVASVAQLRMFITNRLIEEARPGSKSAIRALELLGKISGVDLFTEHAEVTITMKPTDELRDILREKLTKLSDTYDVEDIPFAATGVELPVPTLPEKTRDVSGRAGRAAANLLGL